MQFVISQELAQAIADYLSARTYREVAAMLRGLENLQPVPEPQPKPAPEPQPAAPKAPRKR